MSASFSIPETMRALTVSALGENYSGCGVQRIPTPKPGRGEALVRVRAAGLGFPDLMMSRGVYHHKPELPYFPGGDLAGEVVAVGEDVTTLQVGDSVVGGHLCGAAAEYVAHAVSGLRKIPSNLDFAAAASSRSAYLTAYVSFVRRANLQPGEWVLVHGAAGGVGLAAVDLAKAMGARVIAASASDEKLAAIGEAYSPDVLLNITGGFREKVKEITGGGADVIYDPVGGDVFDESIRCIAFNGRILVVGFTSGRLPTVGANIVLIKGFSVLGVRAGEYGRKFPKQGEENLAEMWRMIAEGALRPHVHKVLPLEAWREAFDLIAERKVIGRVVLDPSA